MDEDPAARSSVTGRLAEKTSREPAGEKPVEEYSKSPVPAPVEPAVEGGDAPKAPAPDPEIVEDPVEILVGLAERGEIDPWNIDIIEVTDRFLKELERCRQLNLQISGRTLFFASTLLRMKSEQLDEPDEEEDTDGAEGDGEDYEAAGDTDFAGEGRLGPIERLEREIQRRLDRKNLRKSPVTLFELIIELKNLEKEERRRRRFAPSDEILLDADDVVSIAHDEGYQDSKRQVLEDCLEHSDPTAEITIAELCKDLGWEIPDVYIPLLFIALDGRCSIRQEEFFGDVYVHVVKPDETEEIKADDG
ncbi:MAG: segregation/condensation protein A [Methanoregula sp.]|jgi:segregation and condensation protein A